MVNFSFRWQPSPDIPFRTRRVDYPESEMKMGKAPIGGAGKPA